MTSTLSGCCAAVIIQPSSATSAGLVTEFVFDIGMGTLVLGGATRGICSLAAYLAASAIAQDIAICAATSDAQRPFFGKAQALRITPLNIGWTLSRIDQFIP
jgi:hypothetical protein